MLAGKVALGLHQTVDGRHAVVSADVILGEGPDDGTLLSDWVAAGWIPADPIKLHGNVDRGAVFLLEQRSSPMATQRALITAERSGKRHRVNSRTMLTAGAIEPEQWRKLENWVAEGWDVKDFSGNEEHAAWFILERAGAEDAS